MTLEIAQRDDFGKPVVMYGSGIWIAARTSNSKPGYFVSDQVLYSPHRNLKSGFLPEPISAPVTNFLLSPYRFMIALDGMNTRWLLNVQPENVP